MAVVATFHTMGCVIVETFHNVEDAKTRVEEVLRTMAQIGQRTEATVHEDVTKEQLAGILYDKDGRVTGTDLGYPDSIATLEYDETQWEDV